MLMTQHYIAILNETTTEGIINTELSHVNVWLKANKLSLNVAKTKIYGISYTQ